MKPRIFTIRYDSNNSKREATVNRYNSREQSLKMAPRPRVVRNIENESKMWSPRLTNVEMTLPNKDLDRTTKQDWLFVICSYQRAETLLKTTLNYLCRTDISPERIRIVVGDANEYEDYIKVLGELWKNQIIIGEVGLCNVKNFVSKYFPEGQELLYMDDDLEALFRGQGAQWESVSILRDLTKFIDDSFIETTRVGASLWGVYAMHNPFFMFNHPPISYDLKLITGPFYGRINTKLPDQEVTIDEVEDVERTLKAYLRDEKVLRFNRVMMGRRYIGPGGLASTRTKQSSAAAHRKLVEMYPELCRLQWKKTWNTKTKQHEPMPYLRLKDRRGLIPKEKSSAVRVQKKKEKKTVIRKKKQSGATRVAKDYGVSSMVLRKRTPRQP